MHLKIRQIWYLHLWNKSTSPKWKTILFRRKCCKIGLQNLKKKVDNIESRFEDRTKWYENNLSSNSSYNLHLLSFKLLKRLRTCRQFYQHNLRWFLNLFNHKFTLFNSQCFFHNPKHGLNNLLLLIKNLLKVKKFNQLEPYRLQWAPIVTNLRNNSNLQEWFQNLIFQKSNKIQKRLTIFKKNQTY